MGVFTGKSVDAGSGPGPDRTAGRTQAAQYRQAGKSVATGLILALLACAGAAAETIKIATWHVELTRKGPGLLLRDILRGEDAQVRAVAKTLAEVAPDIVLLTGIDWDYDLHALKALNNAIADYGDSYAHRLALRPNSGFATDLDLDGDGRTGGPGDAQGWGRYAGYGGMALLSRYPLDTQITRDFSAFLWRDLPQAIPPMTGSEPFPSAAAFATQRLSSVGHWNVTVSLSTGARIHLLTYSATPPVFDGPEDRNGRRNHDETAFWRLYLNGKLPTAPPADPVVLLGNANLDPYDGQGRHQAIADLLAHPRLQDPRPSSDASAEAARQQGGVNATHRGDPSLDTADWSDEKGPGNLRVSYVLPDASLSVTAAGITWPETSGGSAPEGTRAIRHGLVWVDILLNR